MSIESKCLVLYLCFCFFALSCSEATKKVTDNREREDTVVYSGTMHYSDVLEKFDTVYADTIRVFYPSADSIGYIQRELRHKYFESESFTVATIRTCFKRNKGNIYIDTMGDQYVKFGLRVSISDSTLGFYYHLKQEDDFKEEYRIFKGYKSGN